MDGFTSNSKKGWGSTLAGKQTEFSRRRASIESRQPSSCVGRYVASARTSLASQEQLSRYRRLASNMPKRFLYRHLSLRRKVRPLFICALSLLFAAAMRRVLIRYRKQVRLETVEKVRAAYKIQCMWRDRQQRKRIRQRTAISVLVPFLRSRLTRISRRKELAARFLQRVFRSQKERHFVHWMYKNMKYNQAISLIRFFLQRCVAHRCRENLSLQRDERRAYESQYASRALAIMREERMEVLQIQHMMSRVANTVLTPMIPRVVLEDEILQTTGCGAIPPPPLKVEDVDSDCLTRAAEETDAHTAGSGGKLPLTINELPWTSALHSEEGTRRCLGELFESWLPQCPRAGGEKLDIGGREIDLPSCKGAQALPQLAEDDTGTKRPPHVVTPCGNDGSLKQLIGAFLELLVCTESVERKAVEADIQRRRGEMFRRLDFASSLIQSVGTAPPLYANLLVQLDEPWVVRKAEKLFREEQEKRHKMLEEYMVIPLQFLDRPMRSAAAEERRKWIKQRVKTLRGFIGRRGEETGNARSFVTKNDAQGGSPTGQYSISGNIPCEVYQDTTVVSPIMSVTVQGLVSPRHQRQGLPFITVLPLLTKSGASRHAPQLQHSRPTLHSQHFASVASSWHQVVQNPSRERFPSYDVNNIHSTLATSPRETSFDVERRSEMLTSGYGNENLVGRRSLDPISNGSGRQYVYNTTHRGTFTTSLVSGERSQRVEELEESGTKSGTQLPQSASHLPTGHYSSEGCTVAEPPRGGGRCGGNDQVIRRDETGISQGHTTQKPRFPLLRVSRQLRPEPMQPLQRSEINPPPQLFKSCSSGADYVQLRRICPVAPHDSTTMGGVGSSRFGTSQL
ncbi:hypothetical protein, conserved [Trypanosoma brucei brucei TREU927]|uniref:Uncharacterized protein n=1 Tax=Trypanosoma brucei brucei (strain 927/4 GUTat10.1) TaxID=185431 RepID=Q388T2_TRYB2|nr:hypothetical protein, conserved [Trypanosoma brucei brucei TREU927]EAN78688.1 hypothetical protein, conserved [Trypanosoma brucei brucei TREU927]